MRKANVQVTIAWIGAIAVVVAALIGILPNTISFFRSNPSGSKYFPYNVRVQEGATGTGVPDAKVTIDIPSHAPIDDFTDNNGFARILIPREAINTPGVLRIEVSGFKTYKQNIDIRAELLPEVIQLERITTSSLVTTTVPTHSQNPTQNTFEPLLPTSTSETPPSPSVAPSVPLTAQPTATISVPPTAPPTAPIVAAPTIERKSAGELLYSIGRFTNSVDSVSFTPDGTLIVTSSYDGVVRVWQVEDGTLVREIRVEAVRDATVSPNGEIIGTASEDGKVRLWWLKDGSLIKELEGHSGIVYSVAFDPRGRFLASASSDSTVRIWRVTDGAVVQTLQGEPGEIYDVAFSPDGSLIAAGQQFNKVNIWQTSNYQLIRTLEARGVTGVAFTPNSQYVAVTSLESGLVIYPALDSSQPPYISLGRSASPIAFSNDNNFMASSIDGYDIQVFTANSTNNLYTLKGHIGPIYDLEFSPDGTLLASASEDMTVKVWKVK